MSILPRSIVRPVCKGILSLAITVMLSGNAASPLSLASTNNCISGPVADRVLFPEVRLRKLHLVRPDLIPYPIFYEIYC